MIDFHWHDIAGVQIELHQSAPEFAQYCGAPIAVAIVDVALGRPGPDGPSDASRVGARSHWFEGSAKRLYVATLRRHQVAAEALESPGTLTSLGQMLWKLRPTVHQDDFYLDDLRPWLSLQARTLHKTTHAGDAGDARTLVDN